MNPVLSNLLNTGSTSRPNAKSAMKELPFFASPTDKTRGSSAEKQPFADVLAHSKQEPMHLASAFDEPMYSDRTRETPEQRLYATKTRDERSNDSPQVATREHADVEARPNRTEEHNTAAPTDASAPEERGQESRVETKTDDSNRAEPSEADADVTHRSDASASKDGAKVDHVVSDQVDRTQSRSIMQRLRSRLATLGLSKGLGRNRKAPARSMKNQGLVQTKDTMPLIRTLRNPQTAATPPAIEAMAGDLVQEMTQSRQQPTDVRAQAMNRNSEIVGTVEQGNDQSAKVAVPMKEAGIETRMESSESNRTGKVANTQEQPVERAETGAEQDFHGDGHTEKQSMDSVPQDKRASQTDKPMEGSRFQAALKSQSQAAQVRTERMASEMKVANAAATTESGDGSVELDADTAQMITRLSSTRGANGARMQGSTRVAAQAQQDAQINQLHRQIADHMDKAHAKMTTTRTRLTVNLAELGEVQVQMKMRADGTANGRLQVLMQASEAQTVSLLRQGSSALHALLEAKGYQQPILEVGQASENAETDLMNRGGDSSTANQDAQDEATYQDANRAAIGRRQTDGLTPPSPNPAPNRSGRGLHVVA